MRLDCVSASAFNLQLCGSNIAQQQLQRLSASANRDLPLGSNSAPMLQLQRSQHSFSSISASASAQSQHSLGRTLASASTQLQFQLHQFQHSLSETSAAASISRPHSTSNSTANSNSFQCQSAIVNSAIKRQERSSASSSNREQLEKEKTVEALS